MKELKFVAQGGYRWFLRPGSADEVILSRDYQAFRFFTSFYEPREGDVILDVGAHIGAFTVGAAARVRKGHVHAIEPEQQNFLLLTSNVITNALANVSTHRVALTGKTGRVELFLGEDTWDHSTAGVRISGLMQSVDGLTLSDFLGRQQLNHVDFMKMNIEGAEYEVLLKADIKHLRMISCMLVEYHEFERHSRKELEEFLRSCGYEVRITGDHDGFNKGWIAARMVR